MRDVRRKGEKTTGSQTKGGEIFPLGPTFLKGAGKLALWIDRGASESTGTESIQTISGAEASGKTLA